MTPGIKPTNLDNNPDEQGQSQKEPREMSIQHVCDKADFFRELPTTEHGLRYTYGRSWMPPSLRDLNED